MEMGEGGGGGEGLGTPIIFLKLPWKELLKIKTSKEKKTVLFMDFCHTF